MWNRLSIIYLFIPLNKYESIIAQKKLHPRDIYNSTSPWPQEGIEEMSTGLEEVTGRAHKASLWARLLAEA